MRRILIIPSLLLLLTLAHGCDITLSSPSTFADLKTAVEGATGSAEYVVCLTTSLNTPCSPSITFPPSVSVRITGTGSPSPPSIVCSGSVITEPVFRTSPENGVTHAVEDIDIADVSADMGNSGGVFRIDPGGLDDVGTLALTRIHVSNISSTWAGSFLGIRSGKGGTVSIQDSVFEGLYTPKDGPLIISLQYSEAFTFDIDGMTVDGSESGETGGSIWVQNGFLSLTNSVIRNSRSGLSGGALYMKAIQTTIDNCVFEDIWAENSGGALYFTLTNGTVSNSNITRSHAVDDGGAVFLDASEETEASVSLTNVHITHCSTNERGGAIRINQASTELLSTLTISDSVISHNTADHAGGAISVSRSTLLIDSTTFESNTAPLGSAIYWFESDLGSTVTNSLIAHNLVTSTDSKTGALHASSNTLVDMLGSVVCNNYGPGCLAQINKVGSATMNNILGGTGATIPCLHGQAVSCSTTSPDLTCATCHPGWSGPDCNLRDHCATPDGTATCGASDTRCDLCEPEYGLFFFNGTCEHCATAGGKFYTNSASPCGICASPCDNCMGLATNCTSCFSPDILASSGPDTLTCVPPPPPPPPPSPPPPPPTLPPPSPCPPPGFVDDCAVCSGPGTGHVPNSDKDVCGVCFGDGSNIDACGVCFGTNACTDACGVPWGDNATCAGCDGVPFSGKVLDVCGVCDGNASSCLGCDGEPIPTGGKHFDACGVCGGSAVGACYTSCDNSTGASVVFDCAGVCNGTAFIDDCDVCVGGNTGRQPQMHEDDCGDCFARCEGCTTGGVVPDACGICGGDGSTCAGCDGMGSVIDACGLCGGNGSTCAASCDPGIGPDASYDCAGVCGGSASLSTCGMCVGGSTGLPIDALKDDCGVCFGGNADLDTCGKCFGGGASRDACGICDGNNAALDCGVCFGGGRLRDECGVCFGNQTTCAGCDALPNSGLVEDSCGVCGGDGASCRSTSSQDSALSSTAAMAIAGGAGGSIFLLLLGLVLLYAVKRRRARSAYVASKIAVEEEGAPSGEIAVLITDVQSSTYLWEAHPAEMIDAVDMHNEVFRDQLGVHNGYEVRTEGDSFVVVFQDARDAVACAVAIQEKLMECEWPSEVADDPKFPVVDGVWNGLRVRMGIALAEPSRVWVERTHRFSYEGPDMIDAQVVGDCGSGGQIVVDAGVALAVKGTHPPIRLARLGSFTSSESGAADKVFELHEVVITDLTPARHPEFTPLRGLTPTTASNSWDGEEDDGASSIRVDSSAISVSIGNLVESQGTERSLPESRRGQTRRTRRSTAVLNNSTSSAATLRKSSTALSLGAKRPTTTSMSPSRVSRRSPSKRSARVAPSRSGSTRSRAALSRSGSTRSRAATTRVATTRTGSRRGTSTRPDTSKPPSQQESQQESQQ